MGTHDDEAARTAEAMNAVTPVDAEAEDTPKGQSGRKGTATATKPSTANTAAELARRAQRKLDQPAEEADPAKAAKRAAATRAAKRGDPARPAGEAHRGGAAAGSRGNSPASSRTTKTTARTARGSKTSTVGSGLNRVRESMASLVWLAAVLVAGVLALGALFTALDQTNPDNDIVSWVLARGRELAGPFGDLFRLDTAKTTLLVNWGIAALVYLIAGKIVERLIRP